MIETRKTEKRYKTSNPRKMLNMYLASRVLKKYQEDFVDEDTGQVVSIDRNEVLFERGTLIDQDILAQIRFYMEADGVTEVEVSNQLRMADENENQCLYPYIAQAQIGDKKYKFLLYGQSLKNVLDILKDYIELNYSGGFTIVMVKEFDSCVILTDNLKERKVDLESAYLSGELSSEEYIDEKSSEIEESEKRPTEKKFYQIETNVVYDGAECTQTFVVQTFNVDRAMMIITHFLKNKEEEYYKEAKDKGHEYEKREIQTAIESAKPIPVGRLIPKEFSMAYVQ